MPGAAPQQAAPRPRDAASPPAAAHSAGRRSSLAGSGVACGWTAVALQVRVACFNKSCCQRVAPPACSGMTLPELRWSDGLGLQPEHVGRFQDVLKSADTARAGFDPPFPGAAELRHTVGAADLIQSASRRAGTWVGFAKLLQLLPNLHSTPMKTPLFTLL